MTTATLIGNIAISSGTVNAATYGFDYKFMTSNTVPRDPEMYIPTKESIDVVAKSPELNRGKMLDSDVSESAVDEEIMKDYSTSGLSKNTTRMLTYSKSITGTKFAESLTNWDSFSDVFTYSIQQQDNSEYLQIIVKDFSKGLNLTDLFSMTDTDILELNTEQENGFKAEVLAKEDSVQVALLPQVPNPGRYDFLLDDSIVVSILCENEVVPLSITNRALTDSIQNILDSGKVDLLGRTEDGFKATETLDDVLNSGIEDISDEADRKEDNIIQPYDFVYGSADAETSTPDTDSATGSLRDDAPMDILGFGSDTPTYLEERQNTEKPKSESESFFSDLKDNQPSPTVAPSGFSSLLDDMNIEDSEEYQQTFTVYIDGKEQRIKEIPNGYYLDVDDQGRTILVKRKLDLSGIDFGVTWGIANRLEGDEMLRYINLDNSGNSLLQGVSTEMKVNVDTLTGHDIRTFYLKPLPKKYTPLVRSDRIVTIYGSYNWLVAMILGGLAAFLTLIYFIVINRYVSKQLKELKKNYLIRDVELTPDMKEIDVQSMTLD